MDSFDVSGMDNALKDITEAQNAKKAEAASTARMKGWVAPEGYDYTKYNDPSTKPAEDTEPEQQLPQDFPEWAANAAKYEWKDEYGDVGPANLELEAMLFRSEFINRTGLKLGK
jgi:ATP-dependent RNA helicase DDX3X